MYTHMYVYRHRISAEKRAVTREPTFFSLALDNFRVRSARLCRAHWYMCMLRGYGLSACVSSAHVHVRFFECYTGVTHALHLL